MGSVRPNHYDLQLVPDLQNFTFTGKIGITLQADEPTDQVVLNALELEFKSIRLDLLDDSTPIELTHTYSLQEQELTIDLGKTISGEFKLKIDYSGEINDKLAGLYRSKFQINGEDHYCAVTQFQESDARRAFPCFDVPELKATYDIEFIADQSHFTISNTSIIEEENLENGKKRVKFERTPKMSTYLVFFGIGDFEFIKDEYRGIPVRLLAHPGKPEKYGQLGLDYTIKSVKYSEEFFEIDYPLSKLDVIATPDFAAGAMENWGAILFRENLLLVYPGVTSKAGELGIRNVVAHEVSHQWFGNLVSPNSWKYTWLNESFATFFAFKTVDHYEPELQVWDYFVQGQTTGALGADGYHETAPIEQDGEGHAAYTVKTVPILYNKGSSVLRQLEAFLGAKEFQKGLQLYLNKHAYDVASSEDLWLALEESSGKPIAKMMDTWIKQLGYPVVNVKREDNHLELSQRRYTFLNKEYDTTWLIPITLKQYFKDQEPSFEVHLMDSESMQLEIKPEVTTFKINTEFSGFYRVLYDEITYRELGEMIQAKRLSPIDRFNVVNDRYAFFRSGQIDLDHYLDYFDYYADEDHHLSISSINAQFNSLYQILEGQARERIAEVGRNFLEGVLNRIGYTPQDDEDQTITIIRGSLINNAAKFGSTQANKYAMDLFDMLKGGTQIDANLFSSVLQVGARNTNDWGWFENKFRTAQNEVEVINYGTAMSSFTEAELIEKQKLFIFDEIPARNRGNAIGTLVNNEQAQDGIWEWYLANLDNFEKLHPFIYQQSLSAVITAGVKHKEEIQDFFADYVKKNPQVKDPVDKALETMEIRAQIKKHAE